MADTPRAILAFLLCALFTRGQAPVKVFHKDLVEAYAGQNVSLPCVIDDEQGMITQLEWRKAGDGDGVERRLVVFRPDLQPYLFWSNVSLKTLWNESSRRLNGSYLELQGVQRSDSGIYLCDLVVYPQGPITKRTRLRVTDPGLSTIEIHPLGPVSEGEEVRIFCSSGLHNDGYKLSMDSGTNTSVLWSSNGTFVFEKVTRERAGIYSCHPQWTSDVPRLHDNQKTVRLHVSYLDRVDCDRNGTIEIADRDNVTIHCHASASSDVRYLWTKGDAWISDSGSLELWRVREDQTGAYRLSASTRTNHSLHAEFNVTLLPARPTASTDTEGVKRVLSTTHSVYLDQNQTEAVSNLTHHTAGVTAYVHNVSASSSENQSIFHATQSGSDESVTTPETSTARTKDDNSITQNSTSFQFNHTRQPSDQPDAVSSSTGGFDRSHLSTLFPVSEVTKSTEYFDDGELTTEPDSEVSTPRSATRTSGVVVEADGSNDRVHVRWIILLVLVVLLIGLFLRRRIVRKRMDLPPPFKPPPPPTRYTHVRRSSLVLP